MLRSQKIKSNKIQICNKKKLRSNQMPFLNPYFSNRILYNRNDPLK